MHNPAPWKVLLAASLSIGPMLAGAAEQQATDEPQRQQGADQQVIEPQLDRRPVKVLHIPSNVPHMAVALEDTLDLDVFSPIRVDWLTGQDDYLRKG